MHNFFFNNIDNEIKAYLLGFYVGDGCLRIRNRNTYKEYSVIFTQSEINKEIIYLIQKEINPYKNISINKNVRCSFNNKICQASYRITFYSKQMVDDLIKMGYGQHKTYKELNLPINIKDDLIIHFIRGYFDADGTCGTYKTIRQDRKIGNRIKPTFYICSKTSSLLKDIQNFLYKYDIKIPIYKDDNKNVFYLKSGSIKEIRKLYLLLYNNSNYYLSTKKKKFSEVMLTSSEFRKLKDSKPCNA